MVNPLNYSMFNFIAITIATPLIGNALSAEESLDQPPVCGGKLGASIYITYSIDPPTPLGIDIVFIQHSRRADKMVKCGYRVRLYGNGPEPHEQIACGA